ncbi:Extracellular exo-alpha-(1-_5)-L-arabinofuranosidase ArbA [subsurface metagenome]
MFFGRQANKNYPGKNLVWFLYPLLLFVIATGACSQPKKVHIHDPVMIKHTDTYYLFCTGWGISIFSSKDLRDWNYQGRVFKEPPMWAKKDVPGFKGHIWAPDIAYRNGKYYLYYSVSAFGKNTSCIGVVINTTLDQDDPEYKWEDHGMVVQSVPGRDLWNAIDPNLILDEEGDPWLTFGSFWQGLKLVKLQKSMLQIEIPEQWYTIAKRHRDPNTSDIDPGDGAVEAPFIFRKNDYYYLFASFDFCCRGVNSNYKIMVGRSDSITGPYLDKNGMDMFHGGGTPVLEGDERFPGVGHNSVYTFDGTDYLIFHAYDAANNGEPKLRIVELNWDKSGWPLIKPFSELDCKILN